MTVTDIIALGQHWGLPTLGMIGFFYLVIRFVIPALANVSLEQMKAVANSSKEVTKTITESNEKNLKVITDVNEKNMKDLITQSKEQIQQLQDSQEKVIRLITESNLNIHKLHAEKIDGVVAEIREFKDELSQRIEAVKINFQRL